MKDLFVFNASRPALLHLAPPEDAVQGVGWLHDGHPPNGECLILLITLWHVCSLLQPNLDLRFQQIIRAGPQAPTVFFTSTTGPSSRLSLDGGRLHLPPDSWAVLEVRLGVPLLGVANRLAAWTSHPMHVSALGTSHGDRVWLCSDSIMVLAAQPGSEDSAEGLTGTRAYAGYMQDTGGGGSDGECIGYENGSTIVTTVRMDRAVADSVFFEEYLDGPDTTTTTSESQGQGRARDGDGRTPWKPQSAAVQDPHEARGVGVIVKALVQQNACASLLLRTIIVCVAASLCFAHSILVLGERRPRTFIECQKS